MYLDMVGKVKNVQDLIKIQKNDEEKTLFKFEISNGRYMCSHINLNQFTVRVFHVFNSVVKLQVGCASHIL